MRLFAVLADRCLSAQHQSFSVRGPSHFCPKAFGLRERLRPLLKAGAARRLKPRKKSLRLAAAILSHKVWRTGLCRKKAFLFYVVQNVHYLTGYAASLHALAGRVATMSNLPLEERKRIAKRLHGWAKDTDAVRESLDSVYAAHAAGKRLTDDPLFKTIEPATLLYINYEALCAKTSHPAVGMAALLPCFWVYDGLGQVFVKAQKKSRLNKNPFADWIAGYGSPEYSAEVRQALGIADALAAETDETVKAEMTSAFLTACRMELHLMEAAWRGLTWEPVARPH